MATIRQRGNKWQARIQRGGFAEITKTFITKEDAQRWARKVERQIDLGEYSFVQVEAVTLAELLARYEAEVTPHKKGASAERYRLRGLASDKIGKLLLTALTPQGVADYRDRRLQICKPVTVLHDLCALSAVLEHARLEWAIPISNPVRSIRKPSAGQGRDRRLEDGEDERLLTALRQSRNPWIAPMFEFSLETACRRGEALKLQWADVDMHRRVAVFRDTKGGDNRVVPLSARAVRVLSEMPRDLAGRVFPTSEDAVSGIFRWACERAAVTELHWHDLRHEAVSRFFEKGLDTVEVSSISGHKTLACLKRYAHMKAERLAAKLG